MCVLFTMLALFASAFFVGFIGQRRKSKTIRARRGQDPSMRASGAPATFSAITFTTPNVIIDFDSPITLNGVPQYETDTNKLPISASLTGPLQVTLVYDTPGSVTAITIPQTDTAITSRTGGRVPAGTFPAA